MIATLVMLGPGAVYAFSLFSAPLVAAFGWKNAQVTWVFALAIFFLGIGAVAGGFLTDRFGSRAVAWAGILLWGAGNIITGQFAPQGIIWLMLGYGIIGGFGVGMVYVACVSFVIRWYPNRRGFGAGFAILGFGLGAVVYNVAIRSLRDYNDIAASASNFQAQQSLAAAAHAPFYAHVYALPIAQVQNLMQIFIQSGIAFAALGSFFAFFLIPPKTDEAIAQPPPDYTPAEMLATPQFYILWVMLFLNVVAGIIVIGNGVAIMQEITSLPGSVIALWFGVLSLFNGMGRVLWGTLSDRYGRRVPFALVFIFQAISFFALASVHEVRAVGLILGVVLLCYGGGFAIMAAAVSDYFGLRSFGSNFGILLTAWSCAGLVGNWFSSSVKELAGNYSSALQPAALMLIIAVIFPLILEPPGSPEPASAEPLPST
jgi:MFS family permease